MLDRGDAAGESAFVPRSASRRKAMATSSPWSSAATNTSELLILNAQDIVGEPAAAEGAPARAGLCSRQLCHRLGFVSGWPQLLPMSTPGKRPTDAVRTASGVKS